MATIRTESPEFSIRTDLEADDVLVLQLHGELDLSSCRVLDPELRNAEESTARRVVLDLSGLHFIDSTGLELLARAAERSRADGGRLSVLRPAGSVARLIALTGLDSALPFEDE